MYPSQPARRARRRRRPARRSRGGPRGRHLVPRRAESTRSTDRGGLCPARQRVGPALPMDHLAGSGRSGPRGLHGLSDPVPRCPGAHQLRHDRSETRSHDRRARRRSESPADGHGAGRGLRPFPRGPRHPGPRSTAAGLRSGQRVRGLAEPGAVPRSVGSAGARHRTARPAQCAVDDRRVRRTESGAPRSRTPTPKSWARPRFVSTSHSERSDAPGRGASVSARSSASISSGTGGLSMNSPGSYPVGRTSRFDRYIVMTPCSRQSRSVASVEHPSP